jgi:quinol-cytochrome oxidoreductase complex cytochrome b subunit
MGRYQQYERRVRDESERPHPIWRGLGFIFIVLIAVMSYAAANILVEANKTKGWIRVPVEIQGGFSWAPDLYAELILAFFLTFIGFGVLTIVYSLVYRISRPKDLYKMLK